MDEDDDDDYEEHVKDPSDQTPCRIQVDGVSKDDLVAAVVDVVGKTYAAQFEKENRRIFLKEIQVRVDAAVARICEQELESTIREIITQGWQPVDWMGEPKGERVTLKKRIVEALKDVIPVADGKHNVQMERIRIIVRDEVDKAFRGELSTMIEGFKQEAKKMLDNSFRDRIAAAIKEAFKL